MMSKLDKTERKKVFFNVLSPYFEANGYKKYLTGGDPAYVFIKEKIVVKFLFNFFSNDTIGCSPLLLSHYEIEDHILNIGIPNSELTDYKKKEKYHLPTIEFRQLPDSIKPQALSSIEDIQEFANAYISFYENEGKYFIEQYSYLPNILKEINRLDEVGGDWKDLISGMGDAFIRVLFTSKLCNDPHYSEKFSRVSQLFESADAIGWVPYWDKYKAVLEEIKPKYNPE